MNCFNRSRSKISTLLRGLRFTPLREKSNFSIFQEAPPKFLCNISRSHPPHNPVSFNPLTRGIRSYYVDRRTEIHHFRRRGANLLSQNPKIVILFIFIGGAGVITFYYGNLETVPYTKRTHLVLLSAKLERQLGESQFEQLKLALKDKLLPPTNPDSIRIKLIANDIVDALQKGLRKEDRVWRDLGYKSDSFNESWSDQEWKEERESKDEMLNDRWVQESRKSGEARGLQPATSHLEGLSWEVVVVRNPDTNAMCLPGGKIIVFTGLLDNFRSDAEIATIIGHEVFLISWLYA